MLYHDNTVVISLLRLLRYLVAVTHELLVHIKTVLVERVVVQLAVPDFLPGTNRSTCVHLRLLGIGNRDAGVEHDMVLDADAVTLEHAFGAIRWP